jgi:hypothetical protein
MNITDHISESLETFFLVKILKFFLCVCGCGSGIRDGKNSDPESDINIFDPQHRLVGYPSVPYGTIYRAPSPELLTKPVKSFPYQNTAPYYISIFHMFPPHSASKSFNSQKRTALILLPIEIV